MSRLEHPVDPMRQLAGMRARDRRRALAVDGGLLLTIAVLGMLALGLGAVALSPAEVVAALLGLESAPGAAFIVQGVRLPRLVLALLVGAALGLAGALLQSVVRNPLASPDIVGIAQGASAAGVLVIVAGASGAAVTGAAIIGALLAAALAVTLGGRGVSGARFVVVGVALAFLANGVLGYALTRAALVDAGSAYFWLVGSVGSPSWPDIAIVGGVLALCAVLLLAGRRLLEVQAFDDATARALGGYPVAVRAGAIVVTSALTAVAVGAAGPIAFVAFAAGPIARGLRGRGPALSTAALVGAAVVLGCDLIAQHLIPSTFQPPVGLITGALGALVLLALLVRGDRRTEARA
ncbi:FecCD family ABC transporter permease [Microcella humidisoli]|uniref:Iron ABC transporter permease n=1 Tax=Microcella humidisoli TaxID=2963406 RepID=A0ABY5G074_9MICO|nr:iron ABC transporter permease [Microcella humidisoli]UTT63557.1 iron ABC transporter permease [Microcella humidisoli]